MKLYFDNEVLVDKIVGYGNYINVKFEHPNIP